MSDLQMRFHTNRWKQERVMIQKWTNKYNPSPCLYVIEMPATYAKQQRDIGTGTIHKQLPDLGTIHKPSPEFGTMDDGGKLVRESGDNNAKVRQLSDHGADDT
jgi:hypothetical protein